MWIMLIVEEQDRRLYEWVSSFLLGRFNELWEESWPGNSSDDAWSLECVGTSSDDD